MGKTCRNKRFIKTYSKISQSNHEQTIEQQKTKTRNRKPLPKFEELFLEKKDSFSPDIPLFEPRIIELSSDSSSISRIDPFDQIANVKEKNVQRRNIKDRRKPQKEKNLFSTSESSESDDFLSALHSTSQVAEIFIPDRKRQLLSEKNNQKSKGIELQFEHLRLSGSNSLLSQLPKIITSTPTVNYCTKKEKEITNQTLLEKDFSPVKKETSLFEDSASDLFLSCNFNKKNSEYLAVNSRPNSVSKDVDLKNVKKSSQNGLHSEKSIGQRLHPESSNDRIPSSPSCLFDTFENCCFSLTESEEKQDSNFLSKTSSFAQFHRVTTRRRIMLSNYKFRFKKKSFLASKSSFVEHPSHALRKTSLQRNHSNSQDWSGFCQFPSFTVKPGKGWRRSMRAVSNRLKLEPLSFLSQDQGISVLPESFNRSHLQSIRVEEEDPRSYVLQLCDQLEEVPLTTCFSDSLLEDCKKIGEGVYGEVFKSNSKDSEVRVLKLMPIEGNFAVNGEPQKKFNEISSEIAVSKALSGLDDHDGSRDNFTPSFVDVLRCWCVRGRYPPKLLKLWDDYHEKKGSENDRPDIFPDNQLSIVLEFNFAGQDLESYVFNNATQAYHTLIQIASGLAVAEEALQFEHRDLHWGNVLIAPTPHPFLSCRLKGNDVSLKTQGVKATIIDFTLSRLDIDGRIFFNDLSLDPSLFIAEGDYQFEVYRMMQRKNENNWKQFCPTTNIYWLHYLVLKMMKECYFKNKSTKVHKEGLKKMAYLSENILNYGSAVELVEELLSL